MAQPKLALIPASQGTKVYSVLPSDGSGDFDFTRSSAATRINSQGLIEEVISGQSRLEYPLIDGVVNGCPSLLLEPQRTNLNTYSDPTNAQKGSISYASVTCQDNFYWGLGNVINNAIVFGDNSITRYAYYNSSVTSGTQYTLSVFIKMDDNSIPIPTTDFLMVLAGTSFSSGYNVESYGNNVYRVSVSGTAGASNTANGILKVASHSTKGFKISAFQIEQGSYATSYIKTEGSTVTRSAETATGAGNASTFNDSEGVLMAEIANISENEVSTSVAISLSDGSTSNSISLYYFTTSGIYYDIFNSDGTRSGNASMTKLEQSQNNKIALKYKSGDISLWLNGFEAQTNSSTISLSGLSQIKFDYGNGSFPFYGNTKQIQYYNTALTDSELEKISSWTSFTDMAKAQQYSII